MRVRAKNALHYLAKFLNMLTHDGPTIRRVTLAQCINNWIMPVGKVEIWTVLDQVAESYEGSRLYHQSIP